MTDRYTLDSLYAEESPSDAVREIIEERYNICMLFYCLCKQDAEGGGEVKYGAFDQAWVEAQFSGWFSVPQYTLLKTFTGADIDFHPLVYQDKTYIVQTSGIDVVDGDNVVNQTLEYDSESLCSLILEDNKLFACDEFGEITVWNCVDNTQIASLDGDQGDLLCYSENKVYSGSIDIEVWDLETFELEHTITTEHGTDIECLVVANGKLYSSSRYNVVTVWDCENHYVKLSTISISLPTLMENVANEEGLFSLYEDKLYATSSDYEIKVFDTLNEYHLITTLEGHAQRITSLKLHDGKLFSHSRDHVIKIWDCDTHTLIKTLTEPMSASDRNANVSPGDALIIHKDRLYAKRRARFDAEHTTINIWKVSSG